MNLKKRIRVGLVSAVLFAAALGATPTAQAATAPLAVVAQVGEVTVTVENLNVRSGPSTADGIIGKLACGTKIQPNGKTADGSWWRVPFQGGNGFIFAQFAVAGGTCGTGAAAPAAAAPAAPVAAAGGVNVQVTSATLNVRSGPGLNYGILGKLTQGQTVAANGRTADGQWLQIDFNGTKAFVFASFTNYGTGTPAQAAAPAAAPVAAAPAPSAGATAGGFELGAHIKDPNRLDAMKDTGMNWVKHQVLFDGSTPPDLTGLINTIHGSGMKILLGAIGNRGRVSDRGYHAEFAQGLAALAKQGADAIEVWNEPNLDREWGGSGAARVNPEDYANLLRESFTAIRAANPNTLVVGGAPAPTGYFGGNCTGGGCDDKPFLERVAAAGGTNYMDCQGAHFNGSPHPPDMREGGSPSGHYSWYFWGTFDTTYNAIGGRKPICFTEMGYATKDGIRSGMPGGFEWANGTTLQNQAEWSGRLVQLLRSSGRARLAIFWNWNFPDWIDSPGDPQSGYSLLRPDGNCFSCPSIKAAMGR